jgi:beta-galactosidase/beta-glucuronidase
MSSRTAFVLLALTMSAASLAQGTKETQRQYLSGKGIDDAVPWEFFCSAGHQSGEWTTLPVPSCWDAAGFGKLTYGRVPKGQEHSNEQGKYRHRFHLPAEWKGQTIFLVFEGAMTDTQASINGQSAGPKHQGAFYRFKYDVTKLLKLGEEENLLEVTVDKQSANDSVNNAERRGDYWNFGGIFRPVYLEARPPQHVDRVAIDARADGTFAMDVFTAGITSADVIRAQILDLDGKPIGQPISKPLADAKARIETKIDAPRQWTAETPNLYQVEVTLADHDKPLHHIRQRFGFRTIEARTGEGGARAGVYVNGQRILLKGTDRHTFWPESGRASSEKLSRSDIMLMKEMNNNAVRMSHYPPDEHFLDLCDELGLYVLDELAGWHQCYDEPTGRRSSSRW